LPKIALKHQLLSLRRDRSERSDTVQRLLKMEGGERTAELAKQKDAEEEPTLAAKQTDVANEAGGIPVNTQQGAVKTQQSAEGGTESALVVTQMGMAGEQAVGEGAGETDKGPTLSGKQTGAGEEERCGKVAGVNPALAAAEVRAAHRNKETKP